MIDPVLTFSNYGAGLSGDYATAVGHDANGFIYMAGTTYSSEFPTTEDARQPDKNAAADLFVVKLNPNASPDSQVVYSTFIGGAGNDILTGMAVRSDGSVYLTGTTTSTDFPLGNAAQSSLSGDTDAFIFWLNPAENGASGLYYGSYLGGSKDETGGGIAVDSAGHIFVTGSTTSEDFPMAGGLSIGDGWKLRRVLCDDRPDAIGSRDPGLLDIYRRFGMGRSLRSRRGTERNCVGRGRDLVRRFSDGRTELLRG